MLRELRSKSNPRFVLPLSFNLKGVVGGSNEAEQREPFILIGVKGVVKRRLPSWLIKSRFSVLLLTLFFLPIVMVTQAFCPVV